MRFVHDRIPVILDARKRKRRGLMPTSISTVHWRWSGPLPDGRLELYAVSPRVNNARNQDADLTGSLTV